MAERERIEPEVDAPDRPAAAGTAKEVPGATRLPKKPTAKTLEPALLQLLSSANGLMQLWAGQRLERQIWSLSPEELQAEAAALSDVILAYPWMYSYLLKALQNTAIMQLMLLQVMIFRPRLEFMRKYLAQQQAEQQQREAMERGGADQRNGASADLYPSAAAG